MFKAGQRVSTRFFAPGDPDAVKDMVTREGTVVRIDEAAELKGERSVWVALEQPAPFARHRIEVAEFDFFPDSLREVTDAG